MFIEGSVNATKYQEIIYKYIACPNLNDEKEIVQDGALAHTSEATHEFFDQHGIDIIQNPPSSPELNPIEKVWGWISQKLGDHTIESVEEMIELVKYYWENCPQSLINNWIKHNKTVVNDIIASGGGSITERNRSKMQKPATI